MPPFCEKHQRWYEVLWRWPWSWRAGRIACLDCERERADEGDAA